MSSSPRPPRWADSGDGRLAATSHLSAPGSRTTSRSPRRFKNEPDQRYRDYEHDDSETLGMLPKPEHLASSRQQPQASRRWRLLGSLSGLAVLITMALLVAFNTNRIREAALDFAPPNPYAYDNDNYADVNPAWHPLPTGPTTQLNFAPTPTASPTKRRKALVLASYKTQKVDWLQNLRRYTKDWEVYRYVADDPNTNFLKVPTENGREAMAFLTFIVDNYMELPEYVVFSHGHDRAWHQPEHIIDKLMALNLSAVSHEGYVNLRCSMSPGCTADSKFHFNPKNPNDHRPGMLIEKGFWQHQMKQEFGPLPPLFGRRCCAQFAVTRDAIQLRSHDFWISLRQPLLGNMDSIRKAWGDDIDKYRLGSMYEQVWHILFGKPADYCPSKETCENVHFQGAIKCDGETTSFKSSKDNWGQITCRNELRKQIDSGMPLDAVTPPDSDPPPPMPHEDTATGNELLPSEEEGYQKPEEDGGEQDKDNDETDTGDNDDHNDEMHDGEQDDHDDAVPADKTHHDEDEDEDDQETGGDAHPDDAARGINSLAGPMAKP